MMPIEGFQVLLAGSVPPTEVDETSETTMRLVEASRFPFASKAAMKNRLMPGARELVFDHVPFPELKTASSPLMLTRVEPTTVLEPESTTELEKTIEKKFPETVLLPEPEAADRSAT